MVDTYATTKPYCTAKAIAEGYTYCGNNDLMIWLVMVGIRNLVSSVSICWRKHCWKKRLWRFAQ